MNQQNLTDAPKRVVAAASRLTENVQPKFLKFNEEYDLVEVVSPTPPPPPPPSPTTSPPTDCPTPGPTPKKGEKSKGKKVLPKRTLWASADKRRQTIEKRKQEWREVRKLKWQKGTNR